MASCKMSKDICNYYYLFIGISQHVGQSFRNRYVHGDTDPIQRGPFEIIIRSWLLSVLVNDIYEKHAHLSGIIIIKIAFSWTCHPKIKEQDAHIIIHLKQKNK